MELLLEREPSTARITPGKLSVNGTFKWYTLEDSVRELAGIPVHEWKVPGRTAIPQGRYIVKKTWSPKFGRKMYLVEGVPGFSGIRFHAGNDHEDTEGCILLGMERVNLDADPDQEIIRSRWAVTEFEQVLDRVEARGEAIHIEIRNPHKEATWDLETR